MFLDFLWCHRGALPINARANDAMVINQIAAELKRRYFTIIHQQDDYVSFDRPIWEIRDNVSLSWSQLMNFERGRIGIARNTTDRTLRYELSYLRRFLAFVAGIIMVGGILLTSKFPAEDILQTGAMFALVFIAGHLLSIWRTRRELLEAISLA